MYSTVILICFQLCSQGWQAFAFAFAFALASNCTFLVQSRRCSVSRFFFSKEALQCWQCLRASFLGAMV